MSNPSTDDMTLTEVLYAQTNSAGSTTATSTSTLGAGGAGSAITTVTTSMSTSLFEENLESRLLICVRWNGSHRGPLCPDQLRWLNYRHKHIHAGRAW